MPIATVDQLCQTLAEIAPLRLAEDWDNVGLLVGNRSGSVSRVMTCLTISPSVVDEAIAERADLIVSHHPLPFKPLAKINSDSLVGEMLLRLIGSEVAVYSAHTAFDSAANGINQMWAERLELIKIEPLVEAEHDIGLPDDDESSLRPGRFGELPSRMMLSDFSLRAGRVVHLDSVRYVGKADQMVCRVAIACGSGGSFLSAAKRRGCDAMITGEATFHPCLEAESLGIGLVLVGHYQSERFAMEQLAEQLAQQLPELTIWPSRRETDPIHFS